MTLILEFTLQLVSEYPQAIFISLIIGQIKATTNLQYTQELSKSFRRQNKHPTISQFLYDCITTVTEFH